LPPRSRIRKIASCSIAARLLANALRFVRRCLPPSGIGCAGGPESSRGRTIAPLAWEQRFMDDSSSRGRGESFPRPSPSKLSFTGLSEQKSHYFETVTSAVGRGKKRHDRDQFIATGGWPWGARRLSWRTTYSVPVCGALRAQPAEWERLTQAGPLKAARRCGCGSASIGTPSLSAMSGARGAS